MCTRQIMDADSTFNYTLITAVFSSLVLLRKITPDSLDGSEFFHASLEKTANPCPKTTAKSAVSF